ncbi:MAG TPA: RNA polymerase sigma factor [Flavipsychrobacter sp.]|nr:RNA polymerase sigma factor [Flavipsychrobacter sp.]
MTATDFTYLVSRHSDFLRPYAVTLTKDHEDAKDLFQETMLRALLNKEKYQFGTNLKAWLYTIMRNIFINNYRRNKKFSKIENETASDYFINESGRINNNGWQNLRIAEIKNAVENLPGVFRMSFELYYSGYKYQEISELLNEPLGTVKSRIHFARKMLVAKIDR